MPRRIPDYNVAFADSEPRQLDRRVRHAVVADHHVRGAVAFQKHGAKATAQVWEGAHGLEWIVPSPAPHHTFTEPPVIRSSMLAHGDVTH